MLQNLFEGIKQIIYNHARQGTRRSRASTVDPLQIHKPVQKIELPLALSSPPAAMLHLLLPCSSLVPGHQRRIANVTVRLKRLRCCSASHVWGLDISKVSDPKGFAGSVAGRKEEEKGSGG